MSNCSRMLLILIVVASSITHERAAAQSLQTIDFRNYNVQTLNSGGDWVQVVFELPPERMVGGAAGVTLKFDVATDPGPFDVFYRSELRESNIVTFPGADTTQIYNARFTTDRLPDLCGPMTIFQRFNPDNDGPDIEVELTGKNQFGDAVPNDLQIVAFNQPRLRLGKLLKPVNDLKVAVVTSANGAYHVSLNGETLSYESGINTLASPDGTWSQFGLYPHGLHGFQNRQDQLSSGETEFAFTYQSYSKTDYTQARDISAVSTVDPNGLPQLLNITAGALAAGDATSLADSDNVDLSIRRGNTVQSAVTFELEGTSWIEAPDELSFVYESSVFARSGITQTISLFNYESGAFEVMDNRPASRFVDSRVTVVATGDVSRFVDGSKRALKVKVDYLGNIARLRFTANVDQAFWIANKTID